MKKGGFVSSVSFDPGASVRERSSVNRRIGISLQTSSLLSDTKAGFCTRWLSGGIKTAKTDKTPPWSLDQAYALVRQTVATVAAAYTGPESYDADAFHQLDAETSQAFAAEDLDAVREACRRYLDRVTP
jgi:hypothetical protein